LTERSETGCSSRDEANRGANSLSTERGKEGKKRKIEGRERRREIEKRRERERREKEREGEETVPVRESWVENGEAKRVLEDLEGCLGCDAVGVGRDWLFANVKLSSTLPPTHVVRTFAPRVL